ncbi:hypothetical protein [Aliarcobacter butzleri]|uniref:hypothetical protein n=1 Tax=Aliarcobacter butzleri TaxID=28197 RepID=UPI0021B6043A|nr:hypothetical protein [Aliarcobacter butzleri]MCT7588226.1 hypothetical protein [Aliarcobacter butzleri]
MERVKKLNQLNKEFVKNLKEIEDIQKNIDDMFEFLKKDLRVLEIVQKEIIEDRTKFTKNKTIKSKKNNEEKDSFCEKDLENLSSKMKEFISIQVETILDPEEEILEMEFDR